MYFSLNGIPVQDPKTMLRECERHGFDTSSWYGKANCFVDRRGADPSYGYFLVDKQVINEATILRGHIEGESGGEFVAPTGSYNLTLTIGYDDVNARGQTNQRTIVDLYVDSFESITPSWDSEDSFYLIKLVDARYVFSKLETLEEDNHITWYNKVETYLDPEDLKDEYGLDTLPDYGRFIYHPNTVHQSETVTIGKRDGVDVKLPRPFTWSEIFNLVLLDYCDTSRNNIDPVFPFFAPNNYTFDLDDRGVKYPPFTPQNINNRYIDGNTLLKRLMFWTGTTLFYDGFGSFRLRNIDNPETNTKDPNNNDRNLTTFEVILLQLGIKSDEIYTGVVQGTEYVPQSISWNSLLLPEQRDNNELEEYDGIRTYILYDTIKEEFSYPTSSKVVDVLAPFTYQQGFVNVEAKDEITSITKYYQELFGSASKIFTQFPPKILEFTGFRYLLPLVCVESIAIHELGNGPVTTITSISPYAWNLFEPSPVIPRETKFGVILAKFEKYNDEDKLSFSFYDVKVLAGDWSGINIAYNTFQRPDFSPGEDMILVRGFKSEWRDKSNILKVNGEDIFWYTIDQIPYLRLKVKAEDATFNSDGTITTPLSTIVNGRKPLDENQEEQNIIIKNNPPIKLIENVDTHFYIGFDDTAGNDVFHKWTTADPDNFKVTLQGVQNFDAQAPEQSLVNKAGTIRWELLEGGSGGSVDEEQVIQIIEQYLEDNGTGDGTIDILVASVDKLTGKIASTDQTFNFHNAIIVKGQGPVSGSCDNVLALPFTDQERIALVRRNNGMWAAFKLGETILTGTTPQVSSINASFNITVTALSGYAPRTNPITIENYRTSSTAYKEWALGERVILVQDNDGGWRVISIEDEAGIFLTQTTISAATYDSTSKILTVGSGSAKQFRTSNTSANIYNIPSTESSKNIYNMMIGVTVRANRVIQAKRIGKFWFVDVEACA